MTNQASEVVDKLESFFEETLQKMDRQFTSHDFFLKLLHGHQNDYVAALAAHQDKSAPFKDLHWALFQRLQKLDKIKKQQDDYPSQDIFGIASTTTLWRKV
ncbi:MAG TPA: hypothetical protein EYP59_03590 [Thiotrichaceae bacterium]|nr:hypothetical protein [Thiotrichaceae bacterium]